LSFQAMLIFISEFVARRLSAERLMWNFVKLE
jgi:hypothetical protein